MKKIILTASMVAIIGMGSITTANADPFKGVYIGGELGYQNNKLKSNTPGISVKAKNRNSFPVSFNFGMSTVAANKIFMAAQFDLGTNINGTNLLITPGITTKLGYRVAERMVIAGTAGIVYNQHQVSNALGNVTKKSNFAFRPGAEVLFGMDDKNIIGLSYQYTLGNKFSIRDPLLGTLEVKSSAHTAMLKFNHTF